MLAIQNWQPCLFHMFILYWKYYIFGMVSVFCLCVFFMKPAKRQTWIQQMKGRKSSPLQKSWLESWTGSWSENREILNLKFHSYQLSYKNIKVVSQKYIFLYTHTSIKHVNENSLLILLLGIVIGCISNTCIHV